MIIIKMLFQIKIELLSLSCAHVCAHVYTHRMTHALCQSVCLSLTYEIYMHSHTDLSLTLPPPPPLCLSVCATYMKFTCIHTHTGIHANKCSQTCTQIPYITIPPLHTHTHTHAHMHMSHVCLPIIIISHATVRIRFHTKDTCAIT